MDCPRVLSCRLSVVSAQTLEKDDLKYGRKNYRKALAEYFEKYIGSKPTKKELDLDRGGRPTSVLETIAQSSLLWLWTTVASSYFRELD